MQKYTLSMRVLHWLLAVLVICLLTVGIWMKGLPDDYPGKFDYYDLHKAFGIVAFAFILLRVVTRLSSVIPPLPPRITKFDAGLSAITILLLYIGMVSMPIFGYLMSNFGGYPVHVFGFTLPEIFGHDKELGHLFNTAHTVYGYGIIGLIVLHTAGTVKHYIVEKTNLLTRIW